MNGYLTAAREGRAEYEDKHSRFLGHVKSVTTEAEAKAFLEEVRSRWPDATHHVYAYILRNGGIVRFSDDGEPGGTSGQPTLAVLQGAGLSDVICVTARYFGGTLLGSGGLVRAYSAAARMALNEAGTVRMTPWRKGAFSCTYPQYDRLRRFLEDRGARLEDTSFGENVELVFSAPEGLFDGVCESLRDMTAGQAEVFVGSSVFRPSEI